MRAESVCVCVYVGGCKGQEKKSFERILFMTGATLKVTRGNEISKQPLLPFRDCASCPLNSRCENVIKIAFSSDTQTAAAVPPTASAHSPAVQLHGSAAVHKRRHVAGYRRLEFSTACGVSLCRLPNVAAHTSWFICYICVHIYNVCTG